MTETEQPEDTPSPQGMAVLAFVGNLVIPGLGFMLGGRTRTAVWVAMAPVAVFLAFGWSRVVLMPVGYWIAGTTTLVVVIGLAWYAARLMRRSYVPGSIGPRWRSTVVFAVSVGITLNVVIAYRALLFGYETFRMPSVSMRNTLDQGDQFLTDTWAYRNSAPEFGDIVVYTAQDTGLKFVKRVVGLPGEQLRVVDGTVVRDGIGMNEPWAHFDAMPPRDFGRYLDIEVPEDHYHVLGDNRNRSTDSRMIGPIHAEAIDGRMVHRFFPTPAVFADTTNGTATEEYIAAAAD